MAVMNGKLSLAAIEPVASNFFPVGVLAATGGHNSGSTSGAPSCPLGLPPALGTDLNLRWCRMCDMEPL